MDTIFHFSSGDRSMSQVASMVASSETSVVVFCSKFLLPQAVKYFLGTGRRIRLGQVYPGSLPEEYMDPSIEIEGFDCLELAFGDDGKLNPNRAHSLASRIVDVSIKLGNFNPDIMPGNIVSRAHIVLLLKWMILHLLYGKRPGSVTIKDLWVFCQQKANRIKAALDSSPAMGLEPDVWTQVGAAGNWRRDIFSSLPGATDEAKRVAFETLCNFLQVLVALWAHGAIGAASKKQLSPMSFETLRRGKEVLILPVEELNEASSYHKTYYMRAFAKRMLTVLQNTPGGPVAVVLPDEALSMLEVRDLIENPRTTSLRFFLSLYRPGLLWDVFGDQAERVLESAGAILVDTVDERTARALSRLSGEQYQETQTVSETYQYTGWVAVLRTLLGLPNSRTVHPSRGFYPTVRPQVFRRKRGYQFLLAIGRVLPTVMAKWQELRKLDITEEEVLVALRSRINGYVPEDKLLPIRAGWLSRDIPPHVRQGMEEAKKVHTESAPESAELSTASAHSKSLKIAYIIYCIVAGMLLLVIGYMFLVLHSLFPHIF